MKKLTVVVLAVVALIFLCIDQNAQAQDIQIVKLAHTAPHLPKENPAAAMSEVFKVTLEQKSQGKFKVEIYPSGQLGNEREILEALQLGSIQAVQISEGTTAIFFPPMEVLGIPYLFPSPDIAWTVMDGDFGRDFKETMVRQTGLRIIANAAPGGFRNFANNKHPVKTPEDLRGLKIRVMQHPGHIALVKALGATPTPVPYAELYMALKTGVIDGYELPIAATIVSKMDEVSKYYTLDGHVFNQVFLIVNEKWFKSLPTDLRKAVIYAGLEGQAAGRGLVRITEAIGVEELKQKGMQVYYPTQQQREMFKRKSQSTVIDWLRARVEQKWIDGILDAVEKAENEEEQQLDKLSLR